jgi:hypothetical protein
VGRNTPTPSRCQIALSHGGRVLYRFRLAQLGDSGNVVLIRCGTLRAGYRIRNEVPAGCKPKRDAGRYNGGNTRG